MLSLGDFRRYSHWKQIQKLAGYNLVEQSSGQKRGQRTVSKRGRPGLRSLLYRTSMTIVANNVEYEFLAWNDGPQKFEIALNAGDPPDVYWCNPEPKYLKTGLLVPMDEYLTPDEKADYCQVTLKGFVIDGKLCGIPLHAGIWTFGGNRELLEAAKIDWRSVQRTGWTWDEFFEAAKKLTKKLPDGRTQYGFVMPGYNAELWEFLMLNNNAPQIVSPEGELLWTQEKVAEALRFVRKLMDSGVMPREVVGMSATKRWELFNSWDAAMFGRGIPYFEILCLQRRQDIANGKVSGRPIDYISLPIPHILLGTTTGTTPIM